MRQYQYLIKDLTTNTYASWNDNVILFDTQEEAEEIIEDCPHNCIFKQPLSVEICRGVFVIKNSINYKQLKSNGAYKQITKLYNSMPDYIYSITKEDCANG